jgi:hypothetical protein
MRDQQGCRATVVYQRGCPDVLLEQLLLVPTTTIKPTRMPGKASCWLDACRWPTGCQQQLTHLALAQRTVASAMRKMRQHNAASAAAASAAASAAAAAAMAEVSGGTV